MVPEEQPEQRAWAGGDAQAQESGERPGRHWPSRSQSEGSVVCVCPCTKKGARGGGEVVTSDPLLLFMTSASGQASAPRSLQTGRRGGLPLCPCPAWALPSPGTATSTACLWGSFCPARGGGLRVQAPASAYFCSPPHVTPAVWGARPLRQAALMLGAEPFWTSPLGPRRPPCAASGREPPPAPPLSPLQGHCCWSFLLFAGSEKWSPRRWRRPREGGGSSV